MNEYMELAGKISSILIVRGIDRVGNYVIERSEEGDTAVYTIGLPLRSKTLDGNKKVDFYPVMKLYVGENKVEGYKVIDETKISDLEAEVDEIMRDINKELSIRSLEEDIKAGRQAKLF